MANVIAQCERPTLVMSHNKTLAAQLYSEFKGFFPDNAVEYFVSYYDYYQPEAYIPVLRHVHREGSSINEEIERLRISAASSLVSRREVIVVASVSCIYGLGSPEDFTTLRIQIRKGGELGRNVFLERLVDNIYERNDFELARGRFPGPRPSGRRDARVPRARPEGGIFRRHGRGDQRIRALTGRVIRRLDQFDLYPANQYVTTRGKLEPALVSIKAELAGGWPTSRRRASTSRRSASGCAPSTTWRCSRNGILQWHRELLPAPDRPECRRQAVLPDRLLPEGFPSDDRREPRDRFPRSGHVQRRPGPKADAGRLRVPAPSALDNRPQSIAEFDQITGQTLYVSATPAALELARSSVVAEQLIRPTGLLDPMIDVRPTKGRWRT